MKSFKVASPTGEKFYIDGPDDQTQEAAQQWFTSNWNAEPTAEGAPMGVRAAVGAARSKKDRLATLRKFYPDARPRGEDNFVYTDEDGQTRLYNPSGLDLGDIPAVGGELSEAVGGTIGGLLGGGVGSAAGPFGTVGGAVAGAGAGGALARDLYARGMSMFGPTVDTRSLPQQALNMGADVFYNAAGEGIGRGAGDALSSLARSATVAPGAAERVAAIGQAGVDPRGMPGEIAGRPWFGNLTNTAAYMPGGARIEAGREATFDSLQNSVSDAAARAAGTPTPPARGTASESLYEGANVASESWKRAHGGLYENMLSQTENVALGADDFTNVAALVEDLGSTIESSPTAARWMSAAYKEAKTLLEDLEVGAITYKQAREYMTDLGQRLKDPGSATGYVGKSGQGLERLYAALRTDLDNAVSSQAPNASRAVSEHDTFVRKFHDVDATGTSTDEVLKALRTRNMDDLINWAKQGTKRGAARLSKLKETFTQQGATEHWDAFRSSFLQDLGWDAKNATFSPTRFASGWNELPVSTRETLFPEMVERLDSLATVSTMVKKLEKLQNHSNTAISQWSRNLLSLGGIGSGAVNPAMAASPFVTAGFSRAVTSPKFAQWATGTLGRNPLTEAAKGAAGRGAAYKFDPNAGLGTDEDVITTPSDGDIHQSTQRDDRGTPISPIAQQKLDAAITTAVQVGATNIARELATARTRGDIEGAQKVLVRLRKQAIKSGNRNMQRLIESVFLDPGQLILED